MYASLASVAISATLCVSVAVAARFFSAHKLGLTWVPLAQYTSPPSSTGYLVDTAGKRYGVHRGSHYYTIGQRARVGGMDGRWFVAQKGVGESGDDILLVQGG